MAVPKAMQEKYNEIAAILEPGHPVPGTANIL